MLKKWLYILSPFRLIILGLIYPIISLYRDIPDNKIESKCGFSSPYFMALILICFSIFFLAIDSLFRFYFTRDKAGFFWFVECFLLGFFFILFI